MNKAQTIALMIGLFVFKADASDPRPLKPLFTEEDFFSMSAEKKENAVKLAKIRQVEQEDEFINKCMPSEERLQVICCTSLCDMAVATAYYDCETTMAVGCLLCTCIFGMASCCAIWHGRKAVQQELAIIKEWQNNKED